MNYIKQFGIILGISFVGEILNICIPLPIPASIYGLVIMFLCLTTKIIKLSAVHETGKFLIKIMPIMFIPAAVGLIEAWSVLRPVFLPIIVITIISTVVVMVVTGKVTQSLLNRDAKRISYPIKTVCVRRRRSTMLGENYQAIEEVQE